MSSGFIGFAGVLIIFGLIIWGIGRVSTLLFRPKPLWAMSMIRFGLAIPVTGFIFIGWVYLAGWLNQVLPFLAVALIVATWAMFFVSGFLAMLLWEMLIPGFWKPWFRYMKEAEEEDIE